MHNFNEAKAIIMDKNYDYLDQRNGQFDADYQEFTAKTDSLKERIGNLIEENFANVWETPQGIKFLTRFEKVTFLLKTKMNMHVLLQIVFFL